MELESAARRRLLDSATIRGYVGDRVWKRELHEVIDGSGKRAIVVRQGLPWNPSDHVQTPEFPLLVVECYSDHSRNEDGEIIEADGVDNARAVWRAVDNELHATGFEMWGGLRGLPVMNCSRWSEGVELTPHVPTEAAPCIRGEYAVYTVHGKVA